VKHSEIEQAPEVAEAIFGSNFEKATKYANLLARDSETLGLLGPRELDKLWSRHILNSAVVSELVDSGMKVADIGSGAGLPGLPVAIAKPDCQMTLVEPMERRSDWLKEVVGELELDNVRVFRVRGEDLDPQFDVVMARAVAALPKLIRFAIPGVLPGGRLLALKGAKAEEEIEEAKKLAKKFKLDSFEVVYAGGDKLEEPTKLVEVKVRDID
jgi:16S rRNA (guanine527-N7)-methyltransferase